MKRNKCLLASNIIGSLYLIYLILHFWLNSATVTNVWESLGASLAVQMVLPHIVMVSVGVLFSWIGWKQNKRWGIIVGICGYALAALSFSYYAEFVIVEIILNAVAFFQMRTIHISSDEIEMDVSNLPALLFTKANYCAYCGRKRGFMEAFTNHAFCKECNSQVRARIKSSLKLIKDGIEKWNPNTHPDISAPTATEEINKLLKMLDNLESEREAIPFFKSSTQEYRDKLESLVQAYQAKA